MPKTIKEWRADKLISQRELSRISRVALATISRIEAGKQKAAFLTKARIAKALNIGVEDII
jgi:transcriptional regulator with XRE-family HTH domain